MDAMQLSIVAETVAQIAAAMGEELARETQRLAPTASRSNSCTDAGVLPRAAVRLVHRGRWIRSATTSRRR